MKRRTFLQQSILGVIPTPFIFPSHAKGANDRITLACIGVGGRGTHIMKQFIREKASQIIAVCDVRLTSREAAKKLIEERYSNESALGTYHGCDSYQNFEDVLARQDIDAVTITTPDHWHVPIGIAAAKAGKDMFIEKPLSHTLSEGRLLSNAIKKYKRVFQHGTQQRTGKQFLLACEMVRNKKIGKLERIEVGSPASGTLGYQPVMQVPNGFNYSKWLGSAPLKPYNESRTTTPNWWFISDYTIGFISGWGVHHVDIAQWGNNTDHTGPVSLEGEGVFPEEGLCDTATAWDLELLYTNGVTMRYADNQKCKQGVKFIGSEGWVHVNRSGISADPQSLLETTFGDDDIRLYDTPNLQQNLLECIRSRKETICSIETAHRSTSICHLSQITMLLGRTMNWNPDKERFIGDDEGNALLNTRDPQDAAYDFEYYAY